MNGPNPILSIIVPVYNEEENIPVFLESIAPVLQQITGDYEIIFSMDPSKDRTEEIILSARKNDGRIKMLKFSRRFGQPMATLAGLHYSSGDAVVVMDVDMQDPPEIISEMVTKWREGFDVVMAQRVNREGETLIKKIVAHIGYKLINRIAEVPIQRDTGDFRLMSRRVVNEINRLKESHGFLRGLVALVGYPQTVVQFARPHRHGGQGKYNRFFGSLRIGMNGVVSFSSYLLTLSSQFGFIVACGALLVGVVYVAMKLAGVPFPLGNPTIVVLVLFMGGVQLISIGILGEYVGRIYEEVKERPKFIVARAEGIDLLQ